MPIPRPLAVIRIGQASLPAKTWPELAAGASAGPAGVALLTAAAAMHLGVRATLLHKVVLVRRAIDARRRRVLVQVTLDVTLPAAAAERALAAGKAQRPPEGSYRAPRLAQRPTGAPPVVVGAGPAGLFAALTLARAGWPPIVLERGDPVELRGRKVAGLYARGELDPDSNVCFGEGGAGTYSDGKLYTRIGDERVRAVLGELVGFGAPSDILVHHRPHVGTDKLVRVLKAMRSELLRLGASIRFRCALTDWHWQGAAVRELHCSDGASLAAPAVVLATGHSARSIWQLLARAKLPLLARPFALGLRIEHPQAFIDESRYAAAGPAKACLPAADYRLTWQGAGGRAAYSFCMCPGGVVVTTPTEGGALCINGMSTSARQGRFANSALVVTVGEQDFAEAGHTGTFAGADFQAALEQRAFAMGGGQFVAPAARVPDFLAGQTSSSLGETSYRRGLRAAPLHELLPGKLTAALQAALSDFEAGWPGYASSHATLIGLESRTAAPVRLPRGKASLLADGTANLYPAGEGLGYGGGIVSAAVDGIRAAEALLAAHCSTLPAFGDRTAVGPSP